MSKRAEEKALERYPQEDRIGIAIAERSGFVCGYEQSKKDMIEKAVEWLFSNVRDYLYCCVELEASGILPEFFADFKEAMEEE